MKLNKSALLALLVCLFASFGAKAAGWPANFEGVMLQGFYWDSYTDTKWSNLEADADELSQYFKLIWVPNSGKAASNGMGYDPVYWFTNHNSRFGSETALRKMIQTFKAKGTGIIADVVINHRSGKSGWTDFPEEQWDGKTWKIGLDGICCTDEVNSQPNQPHGTGAPDTGDDFGSARDLDHTNANVQNNCKNYCRFLLTDLGYAGFRLDMVKGYGGQYTKIYNQYSNPTYCVGEYWDGSYDKLAGWIEATGKTSAAFDFAFKYALHEAFGSGDMRKLVWMANGNTPQPCGLIHFGYPQYAVTFIDNHDTYRDEWNKFPGNVVAANAFMLCSPGTPCVFLPHWKQYKAQIKKLIEVRNKVGVTNTSTVHVLKSESNCYMAEVIGTKGKLVVKIGSSMDSPSGYTASQIYCSGTDYCVWWTSQGGNGGGNGGGETPGQYPSTLYIQGDVNGCAWQSSKGVAAQGQNGVYSYNVTINDSADKDGFGYFSFATTTGATWDDVNGSDRYGAPAKDTPISKGGSSAITLYAANVNASGCQSWKLAKGNYTIKADLSTMTLTVTAQGQGGGDDPIVNPGNYPSQLHLQGHVNGCAWAPHKSVAATHQNGVYTYTVTVDDSDDHDGFGYFSFATATGATWDDVNGSDRYGAPAKDTPISKGGSSAITLYAANVNASGCQSWKLAKGNYTIKADLANNRLTVQDPSGIEGVSVDENGSAPVYYNLMGVEVKNPCKGVYIVRRGNRVAKEVVK